MFCSVVLFEEILNNNFLILEEIAAVVIDEEGGHEPGEEDAHEAMGPPGVTGTSSSDGAGELEEPEEVLGDDGVSFTCN